MFNRKIEKMKKRMIVAGAILVVAVMGFTSCEKSDDPDVNTIEGVYEGTFSVSSSLKTTQFDGGESNHGTAEISMMGGNQIEVHCFGEDIDTTFMLDYYEHNDSIMVCLTGDDFAHMYGHMLGEGHMGGGMMGDIQNGESQWAHHMYDEHNSGDEHVWGFDMHEMTFTYSFKMMDGSSLYYLRFHGIKQ